MTFFVMASAPVLDLAALERRCSREHVHPAEVVDALMGIEPHLRRKRPAAATGDYALIGRDDAERRMGSQCHSQAALSVAKAILEASKAAGLARFFVPVRADMRPLVLPGWVQHATTITAITPSAGDRVDQSEESAHRMYAEVTRLIASQKSLMSPHVPGFQMILARCAFFMGFSSAKEGWRGEGLQAEALRMLLPNMAFSIAVRAASWHGSQELEVLLARSAAFIQCVQESLEWMRSDDESSLAQVLRAACLPPWLPDSPNGREFSHQAERILPRDRQVLRCPADTDIDALAGALFRLAMEQRRERALKQALGVED